MFTILLRHMAGNQRQVTRLAVLLLLVIAIPFFIWVLVDATSSTTERVMATTGIDAVGYLLFGRTQRRHCGLSRVS